MSQILDAEDKDQEQQKIINSPKRKIWKWPKCFLNLFCLRRKKRFTTIFLHLFTIIFLLVLMLIPCTKQEHELDEEDYYEHQNNHLSLFSSTSDEESESESSQEPFNNYSYSFIPASSPQLTSSSVSPPPTITKTLVVSSSPPSTSSSSTKKSMLLNSASADAAGRINQNHHQKQQQQKLPVQNNPTVVVTTPLGKIRGRSYYVNRTGRWVGGFLAVPYAQPPIRQLRFQSPVSLQSLTKNKNDVFNATEFGPICFQPTEQRIWDVVYQQKSNRATVKKRKLDNYNMSEDCLTLNIYVPLNAHMAVSSGEALPVFFFIHGGSYYMNAGRLYPGQVLASAQNLIVVTFNYRLGPLGFLCTEDKAASGNYGLLDQAMALDFVYQNIAHFGGDPSKITLVGNSAGGASVMFHMFSELSKGKFVGVTVQSGCSGAPWAVQSSPKKHAEDLATKLGCPTLRTEDMVDCIRKFAPETIMKKAKLEDGLSLAYATVIDGKYGGKFLMDYPETIIRSRSFYPVPVLTGFTKDEVTIWFTKFGPTTSMKDLRSFVQVDVVSLMEGLQSVTQANIAAMIHSVTVQYLYRTGSEENDTFGNTGSISDFISDVGLKAPCIKEMNLLEKYSSAPVFLYEFDYYSVDDVKMNRQEWIGAYHESELQFIFGEAYMNYSNHLRSYNDKKMSDFMMGIWGTFARSGNPNLNESFKSGGDDLLKFTWTNYTEHSQEFAVLGLKPRLSRYFLTDRMLFWNFFFPIFRDYSFRFNPIAKPCNNEWEIISKSWIFWTLLIFTVILSGIGFSLFIVVLVVKRKLVTTTTGLRTNNNISNNTGGDISENAAGIISSDHQNLNVNRTRSNSASNNYHLQLQHHHPNSQHHHHQIVCSSSDAYERSSSGTTSLSPKSSSAIATCKAEQLDTRPEGIGIISSHSICGGDDDNSRNRTEINAAANGSRRLLTANNISAKVTNLPIEL